MAFSEQFLEPPQSFTVLPFWFLNDELRSEELKRQIDDFHAHGVYGFLPHARIGLAESIPYMSEAWLGHIKTCVDYAAEKGMVVYLYDEGMYPSGSCCGKVVAENPRHATRCLHRRPKGTPLEADEYLVHEDADALYVNCRSNGVIRGVHYGQDDSEPGAPPSGDILNPESVASFFRLALDPYYETLKEHFGKTVIAVFTDEPDVMGRGHRDNSFPWTWDFEVFLQEYLGYDMRPRFATLFDKAHPDHDQFLRDWRRAVNARLEQVYYAPYSEWCKEHGIALTGHPAQPGDIGTLKYFQIPGQDIVWRYIEPYQDKSLDSDQSATGKCSSSAKRHYGRSRNMNECFGAYGWNFTEDEMWWVTNWLLVRGVDQIIPHAFYYSVRDKRRDERPPDVGPNNVWWDHYKVYADYCRRLSWLLGEGKQVCSVAVLGTPTSLPVRAARVLFESQRDFNYLDTDTLKSVARMNSSGVEVGEMKYAALIVDGPGFTDPETLRVLRPMIDAGRVIPYVDPVPEIPALAPDRAALVAQLDALTPPDITAAPATPHLRYMHLRLENEDLYLFANEGKDEYTGTLKTSASGTAEWWDPETGKAIEGQSGDRIHVPPLRMQVLRVVG